MPRSRSSPPSRVLAVLLSASLAACGREDPAVGAFHSVARPELRLADGVQAAPAPAPWLTLDLAQDGPYVFTARKVEVAPDPADPKAPPLRSLTNWFEKTIRIPIAKPAGRLDRIRARVNINHFDVIRLRWWLGDKLQGDEMTQLYPEARTGEYTIDVPVTAPHEFDAVELGFLQSGTVLIGRVEFESLSFAQRLPQPPAPPAWVRASEDVRPAWGLATHAPLEVALTPPEGTTLIASAMVPQALRVPGSQAVLVLTLSGAGIEPRTHRWPLVRMENMSSSWVLARAPLDGLGGRKLRARFELQTSGADAVCALTQPQLVDLDEQAPTVLLITSDTHRGDFIGAAKVNAGVGTPLLDQLASEGVLFENCMSSTNVTVPSHSAIMTGVSPRDTGLLDNTHSLAPEAVTLAEQFRANGWATLAVVSAAHLDAEWSGLGQGFDRVGVSSLPKRDAGATLGLLEDWMPDFRGRPLFVWLHLFDAHTPYSPPQPMLARFWPDGRNPSDPSLPEPPPNSVPRSLHGVRDVEWIRAGYKGEVAYLDNELVRLFSQPRVQDAIVAFTGDHGESLGGHGIWWDHAGLYQDSLHVPLILRWPGGPHGLHVTRRVCNIDIGRTLLDLAQLARVDMPGRSLLPVVEGRAKDAPIFAVACYGLSASITDGDEHLVMHLRDHNTAPEIAKKRHACELFDLGGDPNCLHDLASERPARVRALRAQLVAWLRAVDARPWARQPAGNGASIERLEALGYLQGEERDPATALFPAQCDCAQCAGMQ